MLGRAFFFGGGEGSAMPLHLHKCVVLFCVCTGLLLDYKRSTPAQTGAKSPRFLKELLEIAGDRFFNTPDAQSTV